MLKLSRVLAHVGIKGDAARLIHCTINRRAGIKASRYLHAGNACALLVLVRHNQRMERGATLASYMRANLAPGHGTGAERRAYFGRWLRAMARAERRAARRA